MKRALMCFAVSVLFSPICFAKDDVIVHFESGEHIAAGSEITIHLSKDDPGQANYTFHLPNGVQLTYGEMLSMGDFYGIPGKPTSLEKTESDRENHFRDIFKTLATDYHTVIEAPQILAVIHEEQSAVDEGLKKGEKPETIYRQISDHLNREWNAITGGSGTGPLWYLDEGRYLKLAAADIDHFGQYALLAYQAGHQVALQEALNARLKNDTHELELAYAMNAFACHYLSDLFASGHLRSPRYELYSMVTPSTVGSLLVTYMHDEEDQYGLHVHDQQNHRWISYGDRFYFDPQSAENRVRQKIALQTSADEIFSAYETGVIPVDQVTSFIPEPDENGSDSQNDISPLFYYDQTSHKLMRRVDMTNVYDRHWTSNWWGITTLAELREQRGGVGL